MLCSNHCPVSKNHAQFGLGKWPFVTKLTPKENKLARSPLPLKPVTG